MDGVHDSQDDGVVVVTKFHTSTSLRATFAETGGQFIVAAVAARATAARPRQARRRPGTTGAASTTTSRRRGRTAWATATACACPRKSSAPTPRRRQRPWRRPLPGNRPPADLDREDLATVPARQPAPGPAAACRAARCSHDGSRLGTGRWWHVGFWLCRAQAGQVGRRHGGGLMAGPAHHARAEVEAGRCLAC